MLSSPVDRTIIETILTLGKRFNLAIVAEGIETQAQFQALKNLGCRSFQGYLFHKPCSVALIGSF
jgi:EAL domain-containing protein (putative c-di-GMP-specific phosphodiesterase class I)